MLNSETDKEKIMNSKMACVLMDQARDVFNQVVAARKRCDSMPLGDSATESHSKIIAHILAGEFQEASDRLSNWTIGHTPHSSFLKY